MKSRQKKLWFQRRVPLGCIAACNGTRSAAAFSVTPARLCTKNIFLVLHLDLHTPTNKTKCGLPARDKSCRSVIRPAGLEERS